MCCRIDNLYHFYAEEKTINVKLLTNKSILMGFFVLLISAYIILIVL